MLDRRRFVALSSASMLVPRVARAEASAYPTRFVRLIVPFPPGGGTDAIARVVSGKLSAIWGQQMVVENKGGGATSIGTDTVAKADPDGYTVLLQSMLLAVNKYLFATLGERYVGIGSKREHVGFALEAVTKPPELTASGFHLK